MSNSRSAARKAAATWPKRRAFLLGQLEGAIDAEPVDEAVGDLGGDDLVAQPVARGSRRRCRSCIACGKASSSSRLERRIVGELASLDRRLQRASSRSTAGPRARAGSGRDSPGRGAAAPRCCRAPRPRGRAGRSPRASRSPGPAAAAPRRRRARRSTAPASAGDCPRARCAATSSVISASSALRSSNVEPALDHLAVERDLDVDLIVRAIDAGADCR